jgi:protein involved in polysaccharide export with SLBB domain
MRFPIKRLAMCCVWISPMLIRVAAIVFVAAGVGVAFHAIPASARPMKECSTKYQAAASLRARCGPKEANTFSRQPRSRGITLGIGDVVSVTIFEAEPGGLFVPSEAGVRPGNFVALPNQTVDTNGNITVPYAGTIRALGRTPSEVQQAIIEALKVAAR